MAAQSVRLALCIILAAINVYRVNCPHCHCIFATVKLIFFYRTASGYLIRDALFIKFYFKNIQRFLGYFFERKKFNILNSKLKSHFFCSILITITQQNLAFLQRLRNNTKKLICNFLVVYNIWKKFLRHRKKSPVSFSIFFYGYNFKGTLS